MIKRNKKKGVGEITLFVVINFTLLIILGIAVSVHCIRASLYIEDMMSDMRSRLLREISIYEMQDINTIRESFYEIKEEYKADYRVFYTKTTFPDKVVNQVIAAIELNEVISHDDSYKVYTLELNINSENYIELPYNSKYKPKKITYLIVPKYIQ